MDIAAGHNLYVVEDAAQGIMSAYKGKVLGTIRDYGCFSFHETKDLEEGTDFIPYMGQERNTEDLSAMMSIQQGKVIYSVFFP